MTVNARRETGTDHGDRGECRIGLQQGRFVAAGDSGAQAIADDADGARVGLEPVAVANIVRHRNTLRRQHQ